MMSTTTTQAVIETEMFRLERKAPSAKSDGQTQDEPAQSHDMSDIYYGVKHLNPDKQEIRLLWLHPGDFDDEVECHMTIASLTSAVQFEALSYVWNEFRAPGAGEVYIRGIRHEVTANLAEVLRHLRFRAESRPLWVDALCINQSCEIEKASQVQSMGDIYASASEVCCWLGPATASSAQGLSMLQELSEDRHLYETSFVAHLLQNNHDTNDSDAYMEFVSELLATLEP